MVNAASDNFFKRIISNSQYYTGIQFAPGIPENKYAGTQTTHASDQPAMIATFSPTSESSSLAYGLRFGLTFPQSAFSQEGSSPSSNKSKFKKFIDKLQYSLGIGVYQSVDNKVKGNFFYFMDNNADGLYQYNISAQDILVELQASYPFPHHISAFTRFGLGFGTAAISNASLTIVPDTGNADVPSLSNSSSSGLAYKLTLGGEYTLPKQFKDWSVDVAYSFGEIAPKPTINVEDGTDGYRDISTKPLSENAVWLGVNYKFG